MTGRFDRRPSGRGRLGGPKSSFPLLPLVLVLGLGLAACGDDEEPELTFEQRLTLLEGKTLTPAEVAERVEVGETLCLLDDDVLDHIWLQLDDEQLDFQDLVVSMLCPDRAILYAGHTGRFVTGEAEESGVVTSTTRPTTTAATRPTTTRPTTTTTVDGATSSDATEPADPATGTSATTTTIARSTTTTVATATSQIVPTTRQTSGTPTL